MPKGGFGNLIALPLQRKPRENGCSVFVNTELRPYPDQWAFLASIQPMAPHDIEPTILRATGNAHPLDVTFIDEEEFGYTVETTGRYAQEVVCADGEAANWVRRQQSKIDLTKPSICNDCNDQFGRPRPTNL